ncbi:uncharacterized protein LOC142330837 isoform X2 [Lycorma delicatula]|uniref:uncharacterized protein LOC142330837 isoform X2 n=1 Tax=Lycorma delicatula TaxID=130591 RepID=UPI003F517FB4
MRGVKRWLILSTTLALCLVQVNCVEEPQPKPNQQQQQKAKVTRTALHVARSLDPDAMETLTVKTKTGDVATLIVKKREGRHSYNNASHPLENNKNHTGNNNTEKEIEMIPIVSSSTLIETKIEEKNENQNSKNIERLPKLVPDPLFVRSSTVLIKGQQNDLFNNNNRKRQRNLVKLDTDGIPLVTGVRMPDDDSDKQVWRNARVINGVLMPYDKTQLKHQTQYRPNLHQNNEKKKIHSTHPNQGPWYKLEPTAVPFNMRTDSETVSTLQPASSQNTPSDWLPTPAAIPSPQDVIAIVGAPAIQEWHRYPEEVVKVIDDTQPVLKEEDKYLRDKILEYIKTVNRQELDRHQQLKQQQSTRGSRMFSAPFNAETGLRSYPIEIHSFTDSRELPVGIESRNFNPQTEIEARNIEASAEIEAQMSNLATETQPRILEQQPIEMEARMMQTPGASVYPTSSLYTPQETRPVARSSVEEGVRTPVLQYAHPELGVQPAEVESRFIGGIDHHNHREQGIDRREENIAYFSHDIHADRSPFAFEPGLEVEETKINENSQRSHGDQTVNPKKISEQLYSSQTIGDLKKYYGKYGDNYYQQGTETQYNRPFWERIGDSIREHVQTGMDRMSEMTRPVVEPLVEATHKISHNLGLGSNRELTTFKEKLGVVSTPSVILPALGLVAGGAALGLGAVAVGRSGGDAERVGEDQLEMEHKRAMSGINLPVAVLGSATSSSPTSYLDANEENDNLHRSNITDISTASKNTTNENTESTMAELQRRRRDTLQDVDMKESTLTSNIEDKDNNLSGSNLWSNTPCAKKTFCNAMLNQPGDDVIVMEKKMATYLAMLNPDSRAAIGLHLDDVMAAVKNRDCSAFHCRHDISDIPVPR